MENLRKGIVHVLGLSVALFSVTGGLSLGAEWKAVNTGLTNMEIRSLAIDPARSTTLYAGTRNGLFKSLDGGATWRSSGLPDRATIHLVIDFVNPSILYAATAPAHARMLLFRTSSVQEHGWWRKLERQCQPAGSGM